MNEAVADVLSVTRDRLAIENLDGHPKIDPVKAARALRSSGYKIPTMAYEVFKTARGPGKLHPSEYFYYRLFDEDIDMAAKRRFIGLKAQFAMHTLCNDPHWFALADNKEIFYATMRGYGLRIPETVGVLRRLDTLGLGNAFNSAEKLRDFLFSSTHFPLFAKPIDGIFSIGAVRILGVDKAKQIITINNQEGVPLNHFFEYIFQTSNVGYLFQELLTPHELLVSTFGTMTLPTIRFLVILTESSAEIISAAYKIPSGKNLADNYWRKGNILGAIDLRNGKLIRAIVGVGLEMKDCPQHPDTNKKLVGMILPDWDRAKKLCVQAASTLPGIRTQSWDIALTSTGPTLIEVNFGGDLNLHQLSHRKGMLQGPYLDHLRRHGSKIES